jgi:prepilin-type processing-associated H-X9-DG protein
MSGLCREAFNASPPKLHLESRGVGGSWSSSVAHLTGNTYQHLLTPNTTNCRVFASTTLGISGNDYAFTPSSMHVGGVNVLFGDGTVRLITDSIDQQIWWAMGSKNSGEAADKLY